MDAQEVIKQLGLAPHPEGGYFKEIYRSDETLPASSLPKRYRSHRSMSTSIYYLLTADIFSCLHRVASDELFHFYLGDPVEMLQLFPDGASRVVHLGANICAGESLQLAVWRGTWQGSRLLPGGKFALLGATVAPGFDFADYEEGSRATLLAEYPARSELIKALTRKP